MEEITCMKEKLSCLFETNDKVLHILQQWDASEAADKDQSRRINDLDVSFKRLESRIRKGDDEFRQLEDMVRNLGSKVERAATVMSDYTHTSKQGRDLKRTESQSNSPENGGSQLPLRQGKHKTNITKHNPGRQVNESTVNIKGYTTEKRKSKKKVRFADDADQHCVEPENLTEGHTTRQPTTSKTSTGSERQNRAAKQHGGLKRKLTKPEDDNRLNYSKKIEMKKRDKKQTVNISLCEKTEVETDENFDLRNFADLLKNEKVKEEMTRQTQNMMKSAGLTTDGLGQDMVRTSLDESWKLLLDEPDLIGHFVHQEGQLTVDTMMEDHMKLAEVIEEIKERAEREKRKGEAEKLPRGIGPDTVLCLDTSGSMEGAAFRDMIVLALQFVEGIQHVSVVLGIDENVGIATFGKKPCVPLHLTNRYDKVKDVLCEYLCPSYHPIVTQVTPTLFSCAGYSTFSGVLIRD
ncbi:uncharacterized protein [Argopecten irradians]|uniref:uncharacterized protein isoform X1 n=1 Tax=Argopecten irradians TaxID=31199 RepID=UPI00371063E3